MKSASVHINKLRLSATGLTPEQARLLAEAVARSLAKSPIDQHGKIPALSIQVRSGASSSIEHLADEIAAGIRRGLE